MVTEFPVILNDPNQNVVPIPLIDYLKWADDNRPLASGQTDRLLIPPIQRGFVWRPYQIQELWDSVISGMPIGSFLVQQSQGDARPIGQEKQNLHCDVKGWFLLDGQQRTLSLLLGLSQDEEGIRKHKIWVDFGTQSKSNYSPFQFRVTTQNQPFGYQPNGRGKLSRAERNSAEKHWENNQKGDQDNDDDHATTKDPFSNGAKPWKAKDGHLIMALPDLWGMMEKAHWDEKAWLETLKNKLGLGEGDEKVVGRLDQFGQALVGLKRQWICLIRVESPEKQTAFGQDDDDDFLSLLFRRVSTGGTPLTGKDLLFSLIKQRWPQAHDLVNQVQQAVGIMMQPTDYVMTAFRFAMIQSGKGDIRDPKAKDFHLHLPQLLGEYSDKSGQAPLKDMLRNGRLAFAFEALRSALEYKPQARQSIGLPQAMLPKLDRFLLQILLFWCLEKDSQTVVRNADDLIRFALWWHVSAEDASRKRRACAAAIKLLIKHSDDPVFPAFPLYSLLSREKELGGQPLLLPLVRLSPNAKPDRNRVLETPDQRSFFYVGDAKHEFYEHFVKSRALLLWFQRDFVTKTFAGCDFLDGQDEDAVPFDYDHILPQDQWSSFQGRSKKLEGITQNKQFASLWPRRGLGNSIGNYRVTEASYNRKRQNNVDDLLGHYAPSIDYMFMPTEEQFEAWKHAGTKGPWTDERVRDFQYAIEGRVLDLYDRYLRESGLEQWIDISEDIQQQC